MKKKELKRLKKALAASIFCIVMFVCALIVFTISNVVTDYEVVKTDELEVSQLSSKLDKGTILQFNDLMVIDEYASYTDYYGIIKTSEKRYYLAAAYDVNDNPYYVSIAVDIKSDAFKQFDAYINDADAYVGDLVIPVCAVEGSIDDNDLRAYYQESVDTYDEQLSVYLNGSADSDIIDTGLKLDYACDTINNIRDYKKGQIVEDIIVYAIFAALLIVFIWSFMSSVKKIKKLKNTPDSEFELAEDTNNTPPEQSTQTGEYYDPQQSQYFNSEE